MSQAVEAIEQALKDLAMTHQHEVAALRQDVATAIRESQALRQHAGQLMQLLKDQR